MVEHNTVPSLYIIGKTYVLLHVFDLPFLRLQFNVN